MSTGSVISWLSTLKMELILNAFFFVLIISFRALNVALAFDLLINYAVRIAPANVNASFPELRYSCLVERSSQCL